MTFAAWTWHHLSDLTLAAVMPPMTALTLLYLHHTESEVWEKAQASASDSSSWPSGWRDGPAAHSPAQSDATPAVGSAATAVLSGTIILIMLVLQIGLCILYTKPEALSAVLHTHNPSPSWDEHPTPAITTTSHCPPITAAPFSWQYFHHYNINSLELYLIVNKYFCPL